MTFRGAETVAGSNPGTGSALSKREPHRCSGSRYLGLAEAKILPEPDRRSLSALSGSCTQPQKPPQGAERSSIWLRQNFGLAPIGQRISAAGEKAGAHFGSSNSLATEKIPLPRGPFPRHVDAPVRPNWFRAILASGEAKPGEGGSRLSLFSPPKRAAEFSHAFSSRRANAAGPMRQSERARGLRALSAGEVLNGDSVPRGRPTAEALRLTAARA